MTNKPTHNLCIGRPVPKGTFRDQRRKNVYTEVGVGWYNPESEQMLVKVNVTLILGPDSNVYLFPRKAAPETDATVGEDGEVF